MGLWSFADVVDEVLAFANINDGLWRVTQTRNPREGFCASYPIATTRRLLGALGHGERGVGGVGAF